MDNYIEEDSFTENVFQVLGLGLTLGIFSYLIPITFINSIKELQTQFNTIIFSFYGLMLIVFFIVLLGLQLTEKLRKGTSWDWLDSYIHDPSKGLIYQSAEKEKKGHLAWLNSVFLMILFSVFVSLLFGMYLVGTGTNALNYNLPKSCEELGSTQASFGCVYLKGENSSSGEAMMYQLVITGILVGIARKISRKIDEDNMVLFTILAIVAVLISTAIAVIGHIAVYGNNEAGLVGIFTLFFIGSMVMVATGSAIFPLIFHSLYNMLLATRAIYLNDESTLLLFLVAIAIIWVLLTVTYVLTVHNPIKRRYAQTT